VPDTADVDICIGFIFLTCNIYVQVSPGYIICNLSNRVASTFFLPIRIGVLGPLFSLTSVPIVTGNDFRLKDYQFLELNPILPRLF